MTTVLRGTSDVLVPHAIQHYSTDNDVVIIGSESQAIPFILFRLAIPLLRRRIGNGIVEEILSKHLPVTSIIFPQLEHLLSKEEQSEQTLIKANLSSHITHSEVAKHTILHTCALILIELMGKNKMRLVIPDMRHLDTGSLDLLKYMYQVYPAKSPQLVFGYDHNWKGTKAEKGTGISWYYALDSVMVLQSFVYAFESVADIKKDISTTPNTIATKTPDINKRLDILDDGLELRVYQTIQNLSHTPDKTISADIVKCAKRCFHLFDFTNALFYSLKSINIIEPTISNEDKATLYHIIGLSAHNRHFFSQNNKTLADFLESTFRKALAYEHLAKNKVAIMYRLIVTLTRRKNELKEAENLLEQAYFLLENEHFLETDKVLLTAWINNIHSFLLMKQGKIIAAIEKHEEGYTLLDQMESPTQEIVQNHIDFTKAVLAENLSTLNALQGNFKKMKTWYAIENAFTEKWHSLNAVPSAEWQSFYFQNLELKEALKKTYQGIKKSKKAFNYILEYFFTLSAADINYRMGNTDEAFTYFQKATVFSKHLSYEYVTEFSLKLLLAKTEIKLNKVDDAILRLQAITDTFNLNNKQKLETTLLMAQCHALLNNKEKSEETINKAIDYALSTGECEELIEVLITSGEIYQLLGDKAGANISYHQTLEILLTDIDGIFHEPSQIVLTKVYLGLCECGEINMFNLNTAIVNLAKSLKQDSDSWWLVPRLLSVIANTEESILSKCLNDNRDTLKTIIKASLQRSDHENRYIDILKNTTVQF